MDYVPLLMLVAVSILVIQYLLEVHVGSPVAMYDAEAGVFSPGGVSRKSTPGQFLGRVVPLQLAAIGLPLLASDLFLGLLLLLMAQLLLGLFR